jgi:glycosyltransferase involved in cell wall biosynthesis
VSSGLPSFDLVVATVGRVDDLGRLLDSLERQTHRAFAVRVVDQNGDDRLRPVLAAHPDLDLAHLRSERGLSRARNAALGSLDADVVAFPDDDCTYPDDLLERVARRLGGEPGLDGATGRAAAADGSSSPSWKLDSAVLTRENLWNRAISFTIFLRREVVARVGAFDEQLGVGSGTPWHSGEEIDYLVRAVEAGARIEYDPSLVVTHAVRVDDDELGFRDGASIGYLLRKHRYSPRMLARMLVRPAGGVAVSLARRDRDRAGYHAATLRGRIAGYRGARRSNSSA